MYVPITGSVLTWAIYESGYSRDEVAQHIDVLVSIVEGWEQEIIEPDHNQFRELAAFLGRTQGMFFLPKPPEYSDRDFFESLCARPTE